MIAARLNPDLVTPHYEDAGLFKADICTLDLALRPGVQRNARQDFIFDGVIDGKYRVPVFFAGRRAVHADVVVAAMTRLMQQKLVAKVVTQGDHDAVLPVQIDGAWRRLVREDAAGFARATHQFIAAAWTIVDGTDQTLRFGALPVR